MIQEWLHRPLSGWRYAAWGCALGALKVGLDFAISRQFQHPFSLLFYVDPLDAPLFHPADNLPYWLAIGALALPFSAVGVAFTVRRLHDGVLSPWYALLFFAPFAHLLFFLALTLAPSRPRPLRAALPPDLAYREPGAPLQVATPPMMRYPLLLAATFGAVLGLAALAISVGVLKEYGAAFVIGSPTITGFGAGAFYARLAPRGTLSRAFLAAFIAMGIMAFVVVFFAIDGALCILVLFPVYAAPAMFGAPVGFYAGRALPRGRLDAAVVGTVLSFFVILGLERVSPLPALVAEPVETTLEVDAPPDRVWPFVPNVEELPPPRELLFRASIAYPRKAWMEGAGVGARRVCLFDTGPAVETVDVWEPGHTLGFTIQSQPDPLRELTLYQTVKQPHNDGYIKNSRGELRVEPLPGGRSRLIGTSWYEVRLAPETYWRLWVDLFVHQIHGRVMGAIKARAEHASNGLVAAR